MGDRVSISFRNGDSESVPLFDHWRGLDLVGEAYAFAYALAARHKGRTVTPLDRLEPGFVMVQFIAELGRLGQLDDAYVGEMRDPMWGDNSNNGHHVIDLKLTLQEV